MSLHTRHFPIVAVRASVSRCSQRNTYGKQKIALSGLGLIGLLGVEQLAWNFLILDIISAVYNNEDRYVR